MKPGLMLFQLLSIVSSGIFAASIIFFLLTRRKQAGKSEVVTDNKKINKIKSLSFKEMLITLNDNPKSKVSVKLKMYSSIICFIIFFIITMKFIFALILGLGFFVSIGWYFNSKVKKRMEIFDNQLIEALGMVTNSVRAGQSLMQALENMVKDTKDPVSSVFAGALRQVKLGVSLNQALDDITLRVKSKDLKIVVTSINLARDTGGNLGEILSRIAATMRERKKIQGKINSLTAQGRMSGTVMGAVPFLLLAVLYFIEPEMMGLLFTTVLGNLMLAVAVVMISLGMFVINKIISIDI